MTRVGASIQAKASVLQESVVGHPQLLVRLGTQSLRRKENVLKYIEQDEVFRSLALH